tara:strand:+ start:556 stop:864 length:309 start_codon:yes stop_codon:yes gene_type:complete
MSTKIKLRSGYPSGYLPKGITYKNYTMLVAIANYSDNGSCCGTAHTLIEEVASIERKKQLLGGLGGFMTAVCTSTFADAWRRADYSNRKALIQALEMDELEL